jgi:putative ABC transport system permease protein
LLLAFMGWRNRVMVRLGLRNIPRRRAQTILIVVGLMLGTLIISAAFGTGDTMTYSFRAWILDELGEVDEIIYAGEGLSGLAAPTDLIYVDYAHFQALADEVAKRQAEGDADAQLVEILVPAILQEQVPVINRTARQNEPRVTVVGYEAATAGIFGEMSALDGRRVTVAELGPGEVYLNHGMADELAAETGHELEIYLSETPTKVTVKAVVTRGDVASQLIMPLDQLQAALERPGNIDVILVSNKGGPHAGVKHSSAVTRLLKELLDDTNLQVQKIKQTNLNMVELIGSAFTTIFIGFGSFSIAAALLLIFLIFVMLAAERKQEMGMARAIGTRQRHLVQMFVFEGTIYDLAAAAVGALLGVGVGLATVETLARGFESQLSTNNFQLHYHVEPRSLIVAYCLGVLLTFVTVTVSSVRVSRLNIVAAIRDLPPPPNPDAGLRALFGRPWRNLGDVFRQLLRLRLHVVLKRVLWDGPTSSLAFFWALIGRGPLTALFGLLSLRAGLSGRSAFFFNMGVSLVLIGIGLMVRWTLRVRARRVRPEIRDRIAFSFAGISLLVFWSLPFDALDFLDLPDLGGGPEMFVLSGIMMVAGAVWTIIYNSDVLLGLVNRLFGRFSNLLPVVRTAIAYPMYNKFRTGLTLAIFALVVFTLVFMSVFVHIFNQTFGGENLEELTGGYDIEAEVSDVNPIPDLTAAIAIQEQAGSSELSSADFELIAGMATRYVDARQENGKRGWKDYTVRVVDDVYMENATAELVMLADGYETAEDAWQAVRDNPGLAIVDSYAVPSRNSFTYVIGGPGFRIEGVYLEDEHVDPIPVRVLDPETGAEVEVKIIGAMDQGFIFRTGIFVSQETWLAGTGQTVPSETYFIKLADRVETIETARALESAFLEHGLEAMSIMAQIEEGRGMNDSLLGLMQAFMGLGLVVGSASLGIISTRAVVERRHQIGVLRAIGYRSKMIQGSFLLESSFVALLGILIGLVLGLILAYNFYNGEVAESAPGIEVSFAVPWTQLIVIVAIAYVASLLTTFLPAWQAARVYPAEALRYE